MADGDAASRMQGYLLKRNQEYRKANLLGQKYNKRWVEVTQDTLVYAGSQQEVLTGKIQVFSMHEMAWVRKESDEKFTVRFPERALTFKLEPSSPGECDKWVQALEAAARAAQGKAANTNTTAAQLEKLKKVAEASLLQEPGEDSIAAVRAPSASAPSNSRLQVSAVGNSSLMIRNQATRSGGGVQPEGRHSSAGVQRQLSPRSLLANTLSATAVLQSPAGGGPPGLTPQQQRAAALAQVAEEAVALAVSNGPPAASRAGGRASTGSARFQDSADGEGAEGRHVVVSSGASTPETRSTRSSMDGPHPTAAGISGQGSAGLGECMTPGRRKHILRQKTPGYLLVTRQDQPTSGSSSIGSSSLQRSSVPTYEAGGDEVLQLEGEGGQQEHTGSHSNSHSNNSSSRLSKQPVPAEPHTAKSHGHVQWGAGSSSITPAAVHEDDVLRLDGSDDEASPPGSRQAASSPMEAGIRHDQGRSHSQPAPAAAAAAAAAAAGGGESVGDQSDWDASDDDEPKPAARNAGKPPTAVAAAAGRSAAAVGSGQASAPAVVPAPAAIPRTQRGPAAPAGPAAAAGTSGTADISGVAADRNWLQEDWDE